MELELAQRGDAQPAAAQRAMSALRNAIRIRCVGRFRSAKRLGLTSVRRSVHLAVGEPREGRNEHVSVWEAVLVSAQR
jgi:hypothetical protein